MRRIYFNETVAPARCFWARQFGPMGTGGQDAFDVAFGLVLPVLCFVFDPVVFQGDFFGRPVLADYRVLAYVVSAVEMGLFLAWRSFTPHLRMFSAPLAGAFFAGAALSAAIGVAILPLTLIGLIFGIGVFGLTPFFTAFVYLRHGIRAMRGQLDNWTYEARFMSAALGASLVIGIPLFVQLLR